MLRQRPTEGQITVEFSRPDAPMARRGRLERLVSSQGEFIIFCRA